jgi:hypothetical protein
MSLLMCTLPAVALACPQRLPYLGWEHMVSLAGVPAWQLYRACSWRSGTPSAPQERMRSLVIGASSACAVQKAVNASNA